MKSAIMNIENPDLDNAKGVYIAWMSGAKGILNPRTIKLIKDEILRLDKMIKNATGELLEGMVQEKTEYENLLETL